MRLFIAVDINKRSQDLIERKLKLLKQEYKEQIKWVKKENWHLTLKFIGQASSEEKEKLIKALNNIQFRQKNKYIQFNRIDAFPDANTAKVIYLGLKEGKTILEDLHDRLEEELLRFGFESDQRVYIPHLTLGRNKNESLKLKNKFKEKYFINIYARIESISLYKSELKADGPEYIELFSIN